ncbi:type VI secretion system protein TssL, long form [Roseomonas fluvialis]|uniref:Cell envelope biogenesis protein OmpA n=1 Tax=Roseomonas fluvialis TaxID=1750527 RepID=A0ABN6P4I3_9PROT|nr:type VI secretion system protein TssL, long form [Roseomonas fluvialis]BDG73406.1 cell envelope biogenesis protein OmpA [Roseomonas fluvialis]
MSDNPFAEPDDSDRTVVRGPGGAAPRPVPAAPAGQRPPPPVGGYGALPTGAGVAPAGRAESAPRLAGEAEALPKIGIGPLAAAAQPLLDLLGRLSNAGMTAPPQGEELRERALRAFRQFETDARDLGISAEQVRAAHYILCASLDDVVLSYNWGQASVWSVQSLVATFHQEVKSGDRFFDVLAGMQKDPGRWKDALEVAYLCLALGFQGRYRLSPRGASELERIREGLYQLLVQVRAPWERELSPHWKGVDAPHRGPRRGIPAWVAACVAVFALGMGYAWLANAMNENSDGLYARMAALPPGAFPEIVRPAPPRPPAPPPPPPANVPPPPPDFLATLQQFLKPEIDQGLLTVFGDGRSITVRLKGTGMFASGSATLEPRFVPILQRVGQGLRTEPGRVQVIGHSDNQPIRTVRFPSNFQLSAARAEAAAAVISAATGDASRFTTEGRADAEPIADNRTAEGREANRRIEVILLRGTR